MPSRAENLDRSRTWWERRRARGICAVCQLPLDMDRAYPVHLECSRLLNRRYTYAQVRAMSPTERRATSQYFDRGRRKDLEQL